jgi:hypothetical protein
MTNASDGTEQDGQRSEVSEVEGTATGADAVPDKTTGTAPEGAAFDHDTEREDEGGDTTIRDA